MNEETSKGLRVVRKEQLDSRWATEGGQSLSFLISPRFDSVPPGIGQHWTFF